MSNSFGKCHHFPQLGVNGIVSLLNQVIDLTESMSQIYINTFINIPSKKAQIHHKTCFPKLSQVSSFKHCDQQLLGEGYSESGGIIF